MVKFAVFSLFFIRHVLCLTFEPDSATNIMSGGTVKLVCDVTVAAFIDPVTLTKDTVQKTSCDNGNICTPFTSDSGRYQYTSNSSAVTVQITNLTQASDRGTWTCRVGTSAPVTYVLSFESTENPDNEGCIDPLLYGLLAIILIVLIVSIIIIIIMKTQSPEKIYKMLGDLTPMKIGIKIVINIVALGIALALGFGLRSGNGKCDNWGIALGLSLFFGVLLSGILIITIHCIYKKENEDDGFNLDNCFRKCSVKPADKKSPASASKVKVQTGKISQNKPTEKVKEETKPRPLPETPKGRKDQLEPIKPDDGEVENSEQKKKKKKKKKKKEPTEVEKTEPQE